jgi:hypothetical protein
LFGGQVLTREAFYSISLHRSLTALLNHQDSTSHQGGERSTQSMKVDEPFTSASPFEPGEEIAVAALPPNSMSSFWWAPHMCRAARRSPVLAAFRERAGARLDALAWAAWNQGGVGTRVLARALAKHWPSPAMLALPMQAPQSMDKKGPKDMESNLESASSNPMGWINWANRNPDSSGHAMYTSNSSPMHAGEAAQVTARALTSSTALPSDWLLRGDSIVLVDRSASRGRAVHNVGDLWKTLRKKFGHRHALLRVVTDSKVKFITEPEQT